MWTELSPQEQYTIGLPSESVIPLSARTPCNMKNHVINSAHEVNLNTEFIHTRLVMILTTVRRFHDTV
jgi:hypothetical protein